MGPVCRSRFKLHCKENIPDKSRDMIFTSYWQMGDPNQRRNYVMRYVSKKESTRKTKKDQVPRINNSLQYTLPLGDGEIRVCKVFFLHTLAITDKVVITVVKKINSQGMFKVDQWGRHGRQRCLAEGHKVEVRNHISSFPGLNLTIVASQPPGNT